MEMFTLYDNSSTVRQCGQGPPQAVCAGNLPGGRADSSINITTWGDPHHGLARATRRARRGQMPRLGGLEGLVAPSGKRPTQHAQGNRLGHPRRRRGTKSVTCQLSCLAETHQSASGWRPGKGADHDTEADQGCGFTNSGTR